jgi:hypothetical protein
MLALPQLRPYQLIGDGLTVATIGRDLQPAVAETGVAESLVTQSAAAQSAAAKSAAAKSAAAKSAAAKSAVTQSAVTQSTAAKSAVVESPVAVTGGVAVTGVSGQAGPPVPAQTLVTYRDAVTDLLAEIAEHSGPDGAVKAAAVIDERTVAPGLLAILSRTPGGPSAVAQHLLGQIWNFRPEERGPAVDLATSLRVYLQSQVDIVWWSHLAPYLTHADVRDSADLVQLDALRRRGALRFRYRRQPRGLPGRAVRVAERRVWPHRVPHTAGMRFPYARPEVVAWLNLLGSDFRATCGDAAAPPLWVNSMARSVEYQNHLRSLGYATVMPSAHCVGYAMDLEMTWMRRYNAHESLQRLLFARQATGDINVIDEGQAWHVCLSPDLVDRLRRDAAPTPAT